ncbi:KpsF/GutQ family sugar-phosphate isomerase [Pontiella sulfatireligans]|uniref:Arabinose 5-phosphate isomerase KdsD n=1 Tax=Pontiella sulfatireligans TaxID=2750658 RepID=A0A6C2UJG2_9BACT|nr:KpsF/GutQ family sugar-phosphate isomerase [Pontiella sulfatireligans]VGO20238.1 Arabinose 5-phosphate isomerase KdsD [Pontiella sulfatireligans]
MNYLQHAREVLDIEIAGLEKVKNEIGEGFEQAVEAIMATVDNGGKVVVTGVGKNLHIGNKIAATFTSTGTPSVLMHPIEAMHGDFGILGDRDILLAMSYSGASDELIALLQPVKRKGVKIIAMTSDPDSPLAQHSDIIVSIKVEQEACPFNMAPTTSTTATLALGDAMAMVLLHARGFQIEDYAKLHPGGAIGRTLLLHVDDVMRTGARCATVRTGLPVRDALLAMTGAKSGCVAVVNEDNTLAGIMTDGDLRRHLITSPNLVELSVEEVMTPNPITLTKDVLALEILNIYEKHNIDDLIVVDADNRVIGAVDIQDMPKLKIL